MRHFIVPAVVLLSLAGCGDDVCDGQACAGGTGGAGGAANATTSAGGAGGGLDCPASGVYHGPWVQKVDGTTAVIRWDSVQGVITLSTPYYGAPIADLIAFPLFRSVLEIIPIVGPIFQGKGTYQMQTAYMAGVVRPMIDNHPNNNPAKFHCFAAHGFIIEVVIVCEERMVLIKNVKINV